MLTRKAWKPEALIRLLAGLFMGLAVVGIASNLVNRALGGNVDNLRHGTVAIASTVVFQFVALGLVGWFLRAHSLSWAEAFGLSCRRPARMLGIVLAATVTVFPLSLLLMWGSQRIMVALAVEVVAQPTVQALQEAQSLGEKALFAWMAVILAPIVEEILFRGIFYPAIRDLGFPRLALWSTALLFAATHANLVTFASLVFFAIALTSLYEHTGTLWAPIGTHCLFNLANFALVLLMNGHG